MERGRGREEQNGADRKKLDLGGSGSVAEW